MLIYKAKSPSSKSRQRCIIQLPQERHAELRPAVAYSHHPRHDLLEFFASSVYTHLGLSPEKTHADNISPRTPLFSTTQSYIKLFKLYIYETRQFFFLNKETVFFELRTSSSWHL
jgi:hypothetical protein